MTREEFRNYVDFLRSQDEITHDVYSGLIDGIDTLEQEPFKSNVLDEIKTEIEQIADEEQKHDKKWAIGLRYAVKIIDKYRVER